MKESELCKKCEGCTLCAMICPVSAISMKANSKGFYIPCIDQKKCIDCKKCVHTCEKKAKNFRNIKTIWAAKTKKMDDLKKSSSGGMFSIFSEYFLKNKGCIYGAILDNDFNVVHERTDNVQGRNLMRGSKYVQSDLKNIFRFIEKDLMEGRPVMFTGTPCQVDAIQIYIESKNISMNNLFTCELICNGVSSPKIWSKYVNSYIGKNRIQDIKFRFKHPKINGSVFAVMKKNGIIDISGYYSQLYTSKLCMNDICYECKYTKRTRVADVTIGDLQGTIVEELPEELREESSIVLINSKKGKDIWQAVKENCITKQLGNEYTQERLSCACRKPKEIDDFWNDYKKMNIRKLLRKYTEKSIIEDIRCFKNRIKI